MTTHRKNNSLLFHTKCDKCGSSDNLAVYDDGSSYCFTPSCESYTREYLTDEQVQQYKTEGTFMGEVKQIKTSKPSLPQGEYVKVKGALEDRGISKELADKYGIYLLRNKETGKVDRHIYEYRDRDTGEVVGQKIRVLPKEGFFFSGLSGNLMLFGQHLVPPGGKFLTIVEGELDAPSVESMTGWPAVSVRSASSAVKDIAENMDYARTFGTIVVSFDKDKAKVAPDGSVSYPGQEAARKVAAMFKPGTVKIVDHQDLKDASDFLTAGRGDEYKKLWWNAPLYTPDGIVAMADMWDEVAKEVNIESTPTPWEGLNKLTYGLRPSELVTLTGGTGMGKTQILREIEYHLLKTTDDNIGLLKLEEQKRDTALGIMSVAASIPFHLPDAEYTLEDKRKAFDETLATGRYFAFDSFGSNSIDNILNRVRFMAAALNCRYIILDHVSIIVSDQSNGDERRALDEITTKLKTLTIELDICLIMVCHLRRTNSKPAEEGGQTSLSDLRGTAGIAQLSNTVIGIERNGQADDPVERNTTTLRVLKNRFAGKTGVACQLFFDSETHRLSEVLEEHSEFDFIEPEGVYEGSADKESAIGGRDGS